MNYLQCPKCKILEKVFNLNIREKSTLSIYNEFEPKVRSFDGLLIYPLYCFICKCVTDWSMDPLNSSNKAFKGVEYFKTRKATKKDLKQILNYASASNNKILKDKLLGKIKVKKEKSWFDDLFD